MITNIELMHICKDAAVIYLISHEEI